MENGSRELGIVRRENEVNPLVSRSLRSGLPLNSDKWVCWIRLLTAVLLLCMALYFGGNCLNLVKANHVILHPEATIRSSIEFMGQYFQYGYLIAALLFCLGTFSILRDGRILLEVAVSLAFLTAAGWVCCCVIVAIIQNMPRASLRGLHW